MDNSDPKSFYYLNSDQHPVGPMDLGAIRKLAEAGIVDSEALVCPAGEEEWKPLKSWSVIDPRPVGPPLTPPPARSREVAPIALPTKLWTGIPHWLAPAALVAGVFSMLATEITVLALIFAIPALISGIMILKQPTNPKRGLAVAAVATGSIGALPALGFVIGFFWGGILTPGENASPFGRNVEDQLVGSWVGGAGAQYGNAMFGYRIRMEIESNGTCTIIRGMAVGSAQPGDPRGTEIGMKASGLWELMNDSETIVATIGQDPEFEVQGTNGERAFSARGGPYESSDGEAEIWNFEIRANGDDIELFSYPPGFNRGYVFVRAR